MHITFICTVEYVYDSNSTQHEIDILWQIFFYTLNLSSGVGERKREPASYGSAPPNKRARIGSPAEAVTGTSLEVDPVDLVPNVLQALDTHNSDKLVSLSKWLLLF